MLNPYSDLDFYVDGAYYGWAFPAYFCYTSFLSRVDEEYRFYRPMWSGYWCAIG